MGGGKGGKGGGGQQPFPGNFGEAQQLFGMQQDALSNALNRTARFNFFDRISPFGRTEFIGTPGTAGFRQVERLAPNEQRALMNRRKLTLGMQGQARDLLGGLGGMFGAPALGGEDLIAGAAPLEQATFQRGLNLLQPEMERQQDRLTNQLIQRGLPRSSEAFGFESDRLGRQQANALENLALSSVGAGRAEQSRLLEADLARRQGTLAELGALGMGGQANFPSIGAPQLQMQSADVMGPFGLASQNINAQNQLAADKKASNTQGAASIGTAALMAGMFMSHSKFKENREPAPSVLDKVCDLNIETWHYKPEHNDSRPHIGPMAEDFNEAFGLQGGRFIHSADALGVCLKAIQELRTEVNDLSDNVGTVIKTMAEAIGELRAEVKDLKNGS